MDVPHAVCPRRTRVHDPHRGWRVLSVCFLIALCAAAAAPLPAAAATISNLVLNPSSVVGGNGSTGTVTLSAPAPSGGVVVTLATSNAAVAAPTSSSVPVAQGSVSANFAITTSGVDNSTTVTITATSSNSMTATLTVTPAQLASLTLTPSSVQGGTSSLGTVTLTGKTYSARMVSLANSNPSVVTAPTGVVVLPGTSSAMFTLTTVGVPASSTATITATYLGIQKSAVLTITAAILSSLTASPSPIAGGGTATGTVGLSGVAPPAGITIALSSSDSTVVQVPPSIVVGAPFTAGDFPLQTSVVSSSKTVTITATYAGVSKSATLTVVVFGLQAVTLKPAASVPGGSLVTLSLILNKPAPAGGTVVPLSSSIPGKAPVPATVTIPAGSDVATIAIQTVPVAAQTTVTLVATNGVTFNVKLVLTPGPAVLILTPKLPSLLRGKTSSATVVLNAPAPPGGATVTLSSSVPTAAKFQAATVFIAEGLVSAVAGIDGLSVSTPTATGLSAAYSGMIASATLAVTTAAIAAKLTPSVTTAYPGSIFYMIVDFDGPATYGDSMYLTSSHPSIINLPPSVITFSSAQQTVSITVSSQAPPTTTVVTLTATYGGATVSTKIRVVSSPAELVSLSLPASSPSGAGGGTLGIAGSPIVPNTTIVLWSSNTAVATVPATVTVGTVGSYTFPATFASVPDPTIVTISASYGGVTKRADVLVTPIASIGSLMLSAGSVTGGASSVNGTVTLNAPAPAGGVVVPLTSSNPAAASVPSSVTINQGVSIATFAITTQPVYDDTTLTITASAGGLTKVAALAVLAPVPQSMTMDRDSVAGGQLVNATLNLSGPAPPGGLSIPVTYFSTSVVVSFCGLVNDRLIINEGRNTGTFCILTYSQPVTGCWNFAEIRACLLGDCAIKRLWIYNAVLSSLTVAPTSVSGGASATGTATLNGIPATPGTITLTSNKTSVHVPASVTTTLNRAQFAITTDPVGTNTTATITGTYVNSVGVTSSATATLALTAAATLQSVDVSPLALVSGASTTGSVRLNGPAPGPSGASVSVTSSDPSALTVSPASVSINTGATSGSFTATALTVTSIKTVTITATYAGVPKTTTVKVLPAGSSVLSSVTLNPTSVIGGSDSIGTVTLSGPAPAGGATVTLSSNSALASVPATVTIATGTSTTFTVVTQPVAGASSATISAAYGNPTPKTATLAITPITTTTVASVSLNPSSVAGGQPSTGTVTITAPAPAGGMTVSLSSSNTSAATVPATVTVPQNASSAPFTISTAGVATTTTVTITAIANGISKSANLTVTAASLDKVTLGYASLKGGSPVTLSVQLTGAAVGSGVIVALSSSDPALQAPPSVVIGAGRRSRTLVLSTTTVSTIKTITLTASASSVVRTATMKLTPADAIQDVGSDTPVLVGGLTGEGFVILNSPAPSGGATVALSSSNTAAATVPMSVTIPAGDQSTSFDIVVPATPPDVTVTISASYRGVTITGTQDVLASVITAINAAPTSVEGGTPVTGTITLSPAPRLPIEVFLSSADPTLVQVPYSVTASAASTTFTIHTAPVAGPTNVAVQASFQNPQQTLFASPRSAQQTSTSVSILLNPGTGSPHLPTEGGLTFLPPAVPASVPSTGTVTLSSPATSPLTVSLLALDPVVATGPPSVSFAVNERVKTFPVQTGPARGVGRFTAQLNAQQIQGQLLVSPPSTFSYYIKPQTFPSLYTLGQYTRNRMVALNIFDAIVILDFGGPKQWPDSQGHAVYGASLFDSNQASWKSNSDITTAVYSQFYFGYLDAAAGNGGNDRDLNITVGINSSTGVSDYYGHGFDFAAWVRALDGSYASGIILGGNDIEPTWFQIRKQVRDWIEGYRSYPWEQLTEETPPFTYYGSIEHRRTWKDDDLWWCIQGAFEDPAFSRQLTYPMAEIYHQSGGEAKDWHTLSRYSAQSHGSKLHIGGVLTTQQACIDSIPPDPLCPNINQPPSKGWADLFSSLSADPLTVPDGPFDLAWSSDLAYIPNPSFQAKRETLRPIQAPEPAAGSPWESETQAIKERGLAALEAYRRSRGETARPVDHSVDPLPRGIMAGSDIIPSVARLIHIGNWWQDTIEDEVVSVYAGAEAHLKASPLLIVQRSALDGLTYGPIEAYQPPGGSGILRIVKADGTTLLIESESGETFVFDVPARKWIP